MTCDADLDLSLALGSTGFEVVVSRPPDMRQVANVVIAVNRIKKKVSDKELLTTIMEVFEMPVTLDEQNPTSSGPKRCPVFRQSSTHMDMLHSVCNSEQRRLLRSPDDSELYSVSLQSITLQDKQMEQRIVNLSMSIYRTTHRIGKGKLITLGIANTKFYISCAETSGGPFLKLEEVHDKDELKVIRCQGMERFLFFRHDSISGASTTFESVKFTGWYISTAPDVDAPVEIRKKDTDDHLLTFMVTPAS